MVPVLPQRKVAVLVEQQEENPTTVASTLNFGTGVANKVIVDILQNIDRENVRSQIRRNQQQGQQALETLNQCKKLSAGAVFKSGRAMLGTDVLQVARSITLVCFPTKGVNFIQEEEDRFMAAAEK
mmetsp:Transcript_16695/g.23795  ORF Transcript_16695/g.23795 Transcript_16695/m.23795 type:complete len:126 (-) Transcript_16695:222-599(-)